MYTISQLCEITYGGFFWLIALKVYEISLENGRPIKSFLELKKKTKL